MYQRQMDQVLLSMATKYPVVTLMGPRQSGKNPIFKAR